MDSARHPVFVYGTLKRGYPNYDAHRLENFFIGVATTVESYPLYIAGQWFSPVVLDEPGTGHRFSGELYGVDQPTLEWLDSLEMVGQPMGYQRQLIRIETEYRQPVDAWIYTKSRQQLTLIHTPPLSSYDDYSQYIGRDQRPG